MLCVTSKTIAHKEKDVIRAVPIKDFFFMLYIAMLKIKYNIKEIASNVFAIIIKDDYTRGMLFCKIQEYYECSNEKFKNKKFSIWAYQYWYAHKYKGCFSYPADYEGFNVPLEVALRCKNTWSIETPYDEKMDKIISKIDVRPNTYIIGVKHLRGMIFKHEMCHALYYTNKNYKDDMDQLTNSLGNNKYKKFVKNLKKLGYHNSVIKDEIQAYMSTDTDYRVLKGINKRKIMHKKYKSIFKEYYKK